MTESPTTSHPNDEASAALSRDLAAMLGEASRIGTWVLHLANGRVEWSRETRELYGLTDGEAPSMERAMAPFSPAGREKLQDALAGLRETGTPCSVDVGFGADGRRIRVAARSHMAEGRTLRLFGTFQLLDTSTAMAKPVPRAIPEPVAKAPPAAPKPVQPKPIAATPPPAPAPKPAEPPRLPEGPSLENRMAAILRPGSHPHCVMVLEPVAEHDRRDEPHRALAEALRERGGTFGRLDDGRYLWAGPCGEEPGAMMMRHVTALSAPRQIDGRTVELPLRCAWTHLDGTGTTREALMEQLDMALRMARSHRGPSVVGYSPALVENEKRRQRVARQFRNAMEEGEVVAHYQPVVSLTSGKISGYEAFARWNHPTRGVLGPNLFMQVFEDDEISQRLSQVMLDCICADMKRWREASLHFGRVGINLSAHDLHREGFDTDLLAKLDENGLLPRHIVLEVSETLLLHDPDPALAARISRLREAGVTIAVDDFGAHASSLRMLQSLPCDILKIHHSFIGNMSVAPKARNLVKTLVDMARGFGCSTVAQGVETREEAAHLAQMGCNRAQGFHYARPASPEDVEADMVSVFDRSSLRRKPVEAPTIVTDDAKAEETV